MSGRATRVKDLCYLVAKPFVGITSPQSLSFLLPFPTTFDFGSRRVRRLNRGCHRLLNCGLYSGILDLMSGCIVIRLSGKIWRAPGFDAEWFRLYKGRQPDANSLVEQRIITDELSS